MKKRIAVIGGGASGLSAALHAASSGKEVLITIYEHTDAPGKKLLITGNGKCNFTNQNLDPGYYHSDSDEGLIKESLKRFGKKEILDFFDRLGIIYKEKRDGYYPYTDAAGTVRDAFLRQLKEEKIRVVTDCGSLNIVPRKEKGFEILGEHYDAVILCMGGMTSPKTGSDGSGYRMLKELGFPVTEPLPALTPLFTKEDLSALKGIRCEASLTLMIENRPAQTSKGELQPFEGGLSGICALDLSGQAARALHEGKDVRVLCDFAPAYTKEELQSLWKRQQSLHPARPMHEILCGMFHKKLVSFLIHDLDSRKPEFEKSLSERIKGVPFQVSPKLCSDFSRAQTVSGGLPLTEVTSSFETKKIPGLYVCGELLDCTGDCGGYNLHWAFLSGALAGAAAVSGEIL